MIALAAKVVIFLAAFAGMEVFAWAMHRYVMHGALWCWHRSHHEPHDGVFEPNDLFAVIFAMPAILFIWLGVNVSSWWLSVGLGTTAYGAAYAVFHATHTGEGGPVPPTGKSTSTDYVYVMEFQGGKISHMTKIWNAGWAMRELGWTG